MRSPRLNTPRCVACLLALVLSGCGQSTPEQAGPTPIETAAAKAKAATRAAELAAEEKPAEPTPAAVTAEGPEVAYESPFPDRTDLFEPRKQARAARQSLGGSADSVVLMGFANLDSPRAVLAIDGVVKPLSSGEEVAGVKVISISPPRAVLQRGRSRWTASIE